MKNLSGVGALWLCCLIVAFSPIMGKVSVGVVSAPLLVFLSVTLASLFFTPLVIKNKQFKALFARETLLKFFLIASFGTALPFTIFLFAMQYTTPVNAAVLQQTEMVYSLIFAYFLLGEKPGLKQLAGTALIIIGVTVLLTGGPFSMHWKGDAMIIGSTWMLQLGSSIAKRLPKELDANLIACARNVFAIPVMLIVLFFMRDGLFITNGVKFWGVLLYTGIFKYALAMVFWYFALRRLDLAKITATYLAYPVLSFMLSIMLGFDAAAPHKILGLAITMAGVYLMTMVMRRQEIK